MRNHKHFGTPQDTSFIGDIVRFIAEHGGLKDWEKDLLINRITIPTTGLDSPEVLRAMEGTSEPYPQQPSEVPDPNQDAPSNPAPCPLSIVKDDDGHFCIAIAERKWKIMRHGIIGNGHSDREDFHQAASEAAGCPLPFGDIGVETTVGISELDRLRETDYAHKEAIRYRSAVDKPLGQIAYDAWASYMLLAKEEHPSWDALNSVETTAWEWAALTAYLSVGLDPSEINKEIQIVAARKRMLLLKRINASVYDIGNVAADIAAIAGPTPQP